LTATGWFDPDAPIAKRTDVARMAGVSPSVVSYVINNGPRPVSRATRTRVEAAIEALNYRPDAIASALRGGATRAVGLLIPSPVNPFFAELAAVIERELLDAGYALSICITDDDAVRERLHLRMLMDRRVDGVIAVSSRALATFMDAATTTPVVALDRVHGHARISSVQVDNVRDAARAVEHLQSFGHRSIGCIAGPWPIQVTADRIAGWRMQQASIGARHGRELIAHGPFSAEGGSAAALTLLDAAGRNRAMPPTALFVTSDAQAHGVMRTCSELGLRIPDDVSIVSFDGTRSARFTLPTLTTMRQPVREMGRAIVELLIAQVITPELSPRAVTFTTNLVVGGTSGPLRERA
jgi:LacI family transcriptional regulator